ncbi:MAG: TCR/Tet family MFS transporter [Mizugakiibacter sp.]|uniref:TCR/Tet family MFS transporter n=1 Tax=Mizugakiibacter sp. TaxID=1972610 RepID=UPI0031C51375|nr:TCR/Tet family MFS transporter [Xanthomonadaceae bacterium]
MPFMPTSAPLRRAAVIFIFVTVLIDILSFGIIIPVLPHLVERLAGGGIARAAMWVGVFGTLFALIQFVCSPIQGALSDRFGRRPVILLSNLGIGVDFLFMALVNTLPLLLVGRCISGMTAASFTTANAYIADVTPPEKRAASYGLLGSAFGIGFIIGPALGGFLGNWHLRAPFWAAALLALANFCYGWFILPEALPPERRSARFDWAHANPLGALFLLRRYPQVFGLATLVFLSNLAHYVLQSVFVLYADYRYGWGAQTVGYTLALVGACNAFTQAWLVGRLVPRIGERRTLLAGLVFGTCGFAVMGLATSGPMFLLGIPLLALWGLAGPSTQALMTRQVDPHEQGRLQGAITSLASLAGIFGPALFTQVFAASIGAYAGLHLSGAAFLLSALLLMLGLALARRFTRAPAPLPA